jgi:putative restriction endonuclease
MDKKVIIANISYNPTGWRNLYLNRKAGHSYATKFPGHESLNFNFDKKNVDTSEHIYGYFQWTSAPKRFVEGGFVIFYSRNTDTGLGEIVGVYGNVKVLNDIKIVSWEGFENNQISFNLEADRELSILFPIPLDADKYKESKGKRLVGQVGYSYSDTSLAKQIVEEELIKLAESGIQQNEFNKLRNIYLYITGRDFDTDLINADEIEQRELISSFKELERAKIIEDLSNLKESEPETVNVNQKVYKRDNKTIAQLKILRDFKCQICGTKITKKDGEFYIEAAHIKPKCKNGCETPDNILILCPNHHKEFDFGDRVIIQHSKEQIEFILNGVEYKIDLKIE